MIVIKIRIHHFNLGEFKFRTTINNTIILIVVSQLCLPSEILLVWELETMQYLYVKQLHCDQSIQCDLIVSAEEVLVAIAAAIAAAIAVGFDIN